MNQDQSFPIFTNQGKNHLFLGDPYSDALDKTTVEEGNIFSPGMWTFGVYHCIHGDGNQLDYNSASNDNKRWYFDDNKILHAEFCDENTEIKSSLCHLGSAGTFGVDFLQIEANIKNDIDTMNLIIGFIEEGPAGCDISSIDLIESGLLINGIEVCFETPPDKVIKDSNTAYAYFCLKKDTKRIVSFRVVHAYPDRSFGKIPRLNDYDKLSFDQAQKVAADKWKSFKTELICPDPRVAKAYENSLFHMLNAMEAGLPRISQWNYPVFWIRDCVIVLRALEYAGFSDLGRIGCDYLSGLIFNGGFGSESDNPGEGIWALAYHYAMTKDKKWLTTIYPDISKRIEWIQKMMTTDKPLFRSGDSRTPFCITQPGANIVCLESRDGLVHGRMDWHSPDFYINCWCYCGLWEGAKLAEAIGDAKAATEWYELAEVLRQKIASKLTPSPDNPNEANDRDSCVSPYPCGEIDSEEFGRWFGKWFRENRIDKDGKRNPEILWTYFEAAQIHNAFLLGFEDMAWTVMDGFLSDSRFGENHIYTEGDYKGVENLPYKNAPVKKGWLKEGATGGNMPHNWTTSEVFTMLRDMFIVEDIKNNRLILANCVPQHWRNPGNRFGVKNMPTVFGEVSFEIIFEEGGKYSIDFKGDANFIINERMTANA